MGDSMQITLMWKNQADLFVDSLVIIFLESFLSFDRLISQLYHFIIALKYFVQKISTESKL